MIIRERAAGMLNEALNLANVGSIPTSRATPETHDYTHRTWGHDYAIHQVVDQGQTLITSGWGYGLHVGDYLLLCNKDKTTRYKVETINYYLDPSDMWNATLSFAPRQEES
jgi:2',3'-cyclic-nucleotide 2'-phosphodiesterase (5'-nucleotidase family)